MLELAILGLSSLCWNAAFFGDALTAWMVVPSLLLYAWLILRLAQKQISVWHPQIIAIGFLWGTFCLASQFWWLIRGPHIYPYIFALGNGCNFFVVFFLLYSISHSVFTILAIYVCRLLSRIPGRMLSRPIALLILGFSYFSYLTKYGFLPLGLALGYPLYWPFLPLARYKTFLHGINNIRSTKHVHGKLKSNLEQMKFVQLESQQCTRLDCVNLPMSFVAQKIRSALESVQNEQDDKTKKTIYFATEGVFRCPLNMHPEYEQLWSSLLNKTSSFFIGTNKYISSNCYSSNNLVYKLLSGDNTKRAESAQCIAWVRPEHKTEFFEKKIMCPYLESKFVRSVNPVFKHAKINKIDLVPTICFEFFNNLSWLSTLNPENELAVLFTNETWFPQQIIDLMHCYILFACAWNDRPLVCISGSDGLNLISFDGTFDS